MPAVTLYHPGDPKAEHIPTTRSGFSSYSHVQVYVVGSAAGGGAMYRGVHGIASGLLPSTGTATYSGQYVAFNSEGLIGNGQADNMITVDFATDDVRMDFQVHPAALFNFDNNFATPARRTGSSFSCSETISTDSSRIRRNVEGQYCGFRDAVTDTGEPGPAGVAGVPSRPD